MTDKRKQIISQGIYRDHLQVGGLDPSTKRIGYAAPNGTVHSILPDKMPVHGGPMDWARRCNLLRARLARTIRLNPPVPTLIVIEQAFAQYDGSSARLDENRGVIRDLLYGWPEPHGRIDFIEINNQHLKIFAAGRNNADKTTTTYAAVSQIRVATGADQVLNDDEGDAFHLRRLGRVALKLEESLAQYELDAISECGVLF